MYRIYRKIPDSFQGNFEFLLKKWYILEDFLPILGLIPGVSLMMREASHVCHICIEKANGGFSSMWRFRDMDFRP